MCMIRSVSHYDCRLTTVVFQPSTILVINCAVDSTPFLVALLTSTYVNCGFEQHECETRLKVNWREYLRRL